MPVNTGIIESYAAVDEKSGITARLFYDPVLTDGQVVTANQPIHDVEGAALWYENTSEVTAMARVAGPSGTLAAILEIEGEGDVPIPPGVLSWTAAEVAEGLGILMRADLSEFSLSNG